MPVGPAAHATWRGAGETHSMRERLKAMSTGTGPVDMAVLTDFDLASAVDLRRRTGTAGVLLMEFAEPYEARAAIVYIAASAAPAGGGGSFGGGPANTLSLEASDDGVHFRKVVDLAGAPARVGSIETPFTANFAPMRARYFRLSAPRPIRIAQVELCAAARNTNWVRKSNMAPAGMCATSAGEGAQSTSDSAPTGSEIDPATVVDITSHMDAEGRLKWRYIGCAGPRRPFRALPRADGDPHRP